MMITEGKTANALGGKTARACDSCLKKRARWFCAADDAFLCQACDTSVHSANQLASRHERVRLESLSFKSNQIKGDENSTPTWHQGFTRKARTPRNSKASLGRQSKGEEMMAKVNHLSLVPEISCDETSPDECEEQLLFCRVPVFDPFATACFTELSDEVQNIQADEGANEILNANELNVLLNDDQDLNIPDEFIASDAELAEFAAGVESLLGTAMEDDDHAVDACFEDKRVVKVEDPEDDKQVQSVIACHLDPAIDMARESLNWDFHHSSPMNGEDEQAKVTIAMPVNNSESKEEVRRMMLLKLNYEKVITAWATQGSPWADGTKPDFNPDDCWPDFMGTSLNELHHPYGAGGERMGSHSAEREARVSRYREKRRTRLFSKKIRYEVRKLMQKTDLE